MSHPSRAVAHARLMHTDDGALILNLRTNAYYSLSESGVTIWEAVATGGTVEDAAAALTEVWEVELDAAREDARRLVAELLEAGLLEYASGDGAS